MSTKSTLLIGEGFHFYRDFWTLELEFEGEVVDAPEEFLKVLDKLVRQHDYFKAILRLTEELDEHDGGLFTYSPTTGKTGEIKSDKDWDKIKGDPQ